MAAPGYYTRQTPVGAKLLDGYQCLITPQADPDISFWEKTVKPFGADGGEKVDTTTMHNTLHRTYTSRGLITATAAQSKCAYDPRVLDQIYALINVETTWTIRFSSGAQWSFYGFLKSFEPDEMVEGTQPQATIVIEPTNTDPSTLAEAAPNYNAGGTGTGQ